MSHPVRRPPSLDSLLRSPGAAELSARHGRERLKEALRDAGALLRDGRLEAPEPGSGQTLEGILVAEASARLAGRAPAGPVRVVNATGVLLHTNLGRAPLAEAAMEAVARSGGYCNLELDLATGKRGRRGEHVRPLLVSLFAPGRDDVDALAVTNTAAALLLALDTLANGRPVAVSRGELVAIGGDFRVPSILARSGATLREVGTTNRTTEADYLEALDDGVGAVLKVHPSNYRIVGYTEEVSLGRLASLCAPRGIPLLYDAGTGAPARLPLGGAAGESPADALAAGADLVFFSGDKTLGGPQAGILLGRKDLVERATRNPLARALRPDKLVLAALAATLDLHLSGRSLEVPFHRMLLEPVEPIALRAEALASRAREAGWEAEVVESEAVAGGGSGTESTVPSRAVALRHPLLSADEAAARFRALPVPVLGRVENDRLLLDLRTVDEGGQALLISAFAYLAK